MKQSVYQHDASLAVEDTSRSQADAMVVIRYPAVVNEAALPAFYRAFTQHPIGGNFKNSDLPPSESERIAQSIITKSNFYVMSLYREISKGLPKNSTSPDTRGRMPSVAFKRVDLPAPFGPR